MGRKNQKKTDNYWDSDEYLKDNPELRKAVEEKERESQETLRRIKEQYGSAPAPSLDDDEPVAEDDEEGEDKVDQGESSDKAKASVIAEPEEDDEGEDEDEDEEEEEEEEEEEKASHKKKKKKAVVKKEKEKPRKKNHKKKPKVEEDAEEEELLDDDEHDIQEEIRLAKEQERKYKEAVKAFMSDEEDDKDSDDDDDENLEDDDDEEEEEVKPYTYRDLEIVAKRVVDWLKGEHVVIKDGVDVSNDQPSSSSSSSSSKKNNKDDDQENDEPKRPNTKVALRNAIAHLCFIKGRLDPDLYVNFCFVSGIWQKDPEGPQGGNDQRVLYADDWKKQVKSPRIKREMQKLGPFIEKSLKDFFTNLAAIKGKLPQTRKEVQEFSQANNQVTLEIAPDDVIDHLVSEGVITISDSFHEITNRKGEKQKIKVLGRVEYHEDKIGKITAGPSSINFKKLIFIILMSMIVFSQFSFLKLLSPSSA